MTWLSRWLLGDSGVGEFIAWTPDRAKAQERVTARYVGRLAEPLYTWSRKYRKRSVQMVVTREEKVRRLPRRA